MVAVPELPIRGDVYLISLDPTMGREIKKTRPCVIVSPDELNAHLSTFLVAPLTTGGFKYPFRIPCRFQKKDGHLVLDQVRTVDKRRLVKRLGRITPATLGKALETLQEMFAP
jgi:mRNA interferase MazF